jgi:hypothetical protein
MIDSVSIKNSTKSWKNKNETLTRDYNEYIEKFLDIYLQKIDLYNKYQNNEDCIWLYPLRTLFEMLLRFESFVSQSDENRKKLANNATWKFAKNNFDEDESKNIEMKNYYLSLKSNNKEYPKYDFLLKESKIFKDISYIK